MRIFHKILPKPEPAKESMTFGVKTSKKDRPSTAPRLAPAFTYTTVAGNMPN